MSEHHPHDFASVVDNLHDGLYLVDRERRITFWNKAAERLTGYAAAEVLGLRCADNILMHVDAEGRPLCHGRCPLAETMRDGAAREAVVYLHHKQGHRVPVSVRVAPLVDRGGDVTGGTELFYDASAVEALHAKAASLERLALLDPLTHLPNRRYLEAEIDALLAKRDRTDEPFGVVFLDIDHFKRINDEFGHEYGDLVLQTVGRSLEAAIRPFDVVGRWGGEEFVGIFPGVDDRSLREIADRLCRIVGASRVHLASDTRSVTISAGATLARSGDDARSVVARADALMYLSKRSGRGRATLDPQDVSAPAPAYTVRPLAFAAY